VAPSDRCCSSTRLLKLMRQKTALSRSSWLAARTAAAGLEADPLRLCHPASQVQEWRRVEPNRLEVAPGPLSLTMRWPLILAGN
jgi:hypothetical protein